MNMLRKAALALGAAFSMGAMTAGDAALAKGPELKLNYNFGLTTDYIFRGFSQTRRGPAVQGGVDLTYGIFYAGAWGSGLSFDGATDVNGVPFTASMELDLYTGVKPVLKTSHGDYTFDFGIIGYTYPRANNPGLTLNYLELKAGVSKELWKDSTFQTTLFYSPDYQLQGGAVWTSETSLAQNFPAWGKVVPSVSALVGAQWGDSASYRFSFTNGADNYVYWNAGATLTLDEKVSFDVRYWDTNISDTNSFCSGTVFQCTSRTMATLKFSF